MIYAKLTRFAGSREIVAFCERLLRERPAAGEMPSAKWQANYRRKIEQLRPRCNPVTPGVMKSRGRGVTNKRKKS